MQLDLSKGMSLDLTKTGNTVFTFGLSWDPSQVGEPVDIDASAFLLGTVDGKYKLQDIKNAVFFNNLSSPTGAVILSGDNRDGVGDGYDESIFIDITKLPADVSQVNVYINIFKPAISFSKVRNAKVDILDSNGRVLANFCMSEQLTDENSLLVGTVTKNGASWDFIARGEGYVIADLNTIVNTLNVQGSN